MHYLHSFRIVHRDIKPENLLVYKYSDGTKRLKLCDFGLATEKKSNEKLHFVCGTATYVAPEMIRSTGIKPYSFNYRFKYIFVKGMARGLTSGRWV